MNHCEEDVLATASSVRAKYPKGRNKGRCLDACNEIFEALYAKGYNVSIQFGWLDSQIHSWVEVWFDGRKRLLDVTADQFGEYPPILWATSEECPLYVYDVS
jgi:hypothetical protein